MDILPDILDHNLKIIFCGSAPGRTSASTGNYYAHPRNRFWSVLYETGLIDAPMKPAQFQDLRQKKYGLTDLCKFTFGNDDDLPQGALMADRLLEAVKKYQPLFLAFTSRNAGRVLCGNRADYGRQESIGETRVYVLPTTSPRWGEKWWNSKKDHWHHFAKTVLSS